MKLKRVLAVAGLLLILLLLILLLFLAFSGAEQEKLLAVLFCLIVVPTVIYVFIWVGNLLRKL